MQKATHDTDRELVKRFDQILNIGPKIAEQFKEIGLQEPMELIGKDPFILYKQLNEVRNTFIDPCVLDCYMSAIDYMEGNPPREWWFYTKDRKENYSSKVDRLR
jgi:hypothetical protein